MAGISHHPVQAGPAGPGATNAVVDVLLNDFQSTLLGHLAQVE
jgi:hypothetical protein